jgi:hypothetical protein
VFWYIRFLKKNTWNFLRFFSSPLIFYECRPYHRAGGRRRRRCPHIAAAATAESSAAAFI